MNDERFWTIWETVWTSRSDGANPYTRLQTIAEQLGMEELLRFSQIYSHHVDSLFTPAHLCAVFLINEGILGDQDFSIYSEAIVAVPRAVFMDVKSVPDHLLQHAPYAFFFKFDTYPFASLPVVVGNRRFGDDWVRESKREEWRCEPTDIDRVQLDGRVGADVVTRELCVKLVPQLYEALHQRCDWSEHR